MEMTSGTAVVRELPAEMQHVYLLTQTRGRLPPASEPARGVWGYLQEQK